MKIIDTYDSIFNVYRDGVFSRKLWENYAENIYSGLKEKIEKDYLDRLVDTADYDKIILPVLNGICTNKNSVQKVHNSFLEATENLDETIRNKFNVDLDVTIILYLGLCNAAGWATSIHGNKVILLGIEKIVELDWCSKEDMTALIYHELGHIYHSIFEKKKLFYSKKERSLQQLYREGIAMVFEQILCDDENFFHQNKDGWLDWCKNNEALLKKEYLKRLNDNYSVQDFFGDWCSFMEHSDVGYYLGTAFVRDMMKEYSLEQIAKMSMKTVAAHFYEFANK